MCTIPEVDYCFNRFCISTPLEAAYIWTLATRLAMGGGVRFLETEFSSNGGDYCDTSFYGIVGRTIILLLMQKKETESLPTTNPPS